MTDDTLTSLSALLPPQVGFPPTTSPATSYPSTPSSPALAIQTNAPPAAPLLPVPLSPSSGEEEAEDGSSGEEEVEDGGGQDEDVKAEVNNDEQSNEEKMRQYKARFIIKLSKMYSSYPKTPGSNKGLYVCSKFTSHVKWREASCAKYIGGKMVANHCRRCEQVLCWYCPLCDTISTSTNRAQHNKRLHGIGRQGKNSHKNQRHSKLCKGETILKCKKESEKENTPPQPTQPTPARRSSRLRSEPR